MTTHSELEAQLESLEFAPDSDEAVNRDRMVALLVETLQCFERSCFPAHFTDSALILSANRTRTLLHHHRKLDRWLQFGGHCDGDSDVLAVARREAEEESGIESLALWNLKPFDLDIHKIPPRGEEPEHWHYDIRYLFVAPPDAVFRQSAESRELRWFTPEEMGALPLDTGLRRLIAKWRVLIATGS